MSTQQMNVTISATDQMTPTMKTAIASTEQLIQILKQLDIGIGTVQAKMRTAVGAPIQFDTATASIQKFTAGLNQAGINMTTLDSKVSTTQSKFASFGQTLLQNGTAFGVAGASAFGLFNAIDNLEKVQLRAETATLRSSTAQTALAAAEKTLAEAKASGTASTEQLSILESRVADARERVSVTTQRATIFQQDYSEAIAGLALQIGPQAIALAGSLATVYNTLSTTFAKSGGIINTLKTAFTGLNAQEAASAAQAFTMGGAFNSMAVSENVAAGATRGLSLALKGLLISTGIGAIVVIGTALAELAGSMGETGAAAQDFSAQSTTAFGTATASVTDFETTATQSMKNVETQTVSSGSAIANAMVEIANATGQSLDTIKRQTQQNLLEMLKMQKSALEEQLRNPPTTIPLLDALQGKPITPEEKTDKITKDLDAVNKKIAELEPSAAKADAAFVKMFQGMNLGISTFLGTLTEADQSLLLSGGGVNTIIDQMSMLEQSATDTAASIAGPFVDAWKKSGLSMETARTLAVNYIKTVMKDSIIPMDLLVSKTEELFKVEEKVNNQRATEVAAIQGQAQAYVGLATAQTLSVGQMESINKVMSASIEPMNEIMITNQQIADVNAVATQSMFDWVGAVAANAEASINLNAINEDTLATFIQLEAARVKGTQTAAQFVTNAKLEATATQATTAALKEFVTTTLGVQIPPWLEVTPQLLKAIVTEFEATGNAAGTLAQAMNAELAPAFDSIKTALDAESIGKMKSALKDLPGFKDFSKQTQKDLFDMTESLKKASDRFKEFGTDVNQAILSITTGQGTGKSIADLMNQLNTDFDSFAKIDTSGITKAFDPIFNMLDQLTGTEARSVFPKFHELIQDIQAAFDTGQTINSQEAVDIITQNIDVLEQFPGVFEKIKAALPPDVAAEVDKLEASMGKFGTTWSSLIDTAKKGQTLSFGTPGSSGAVPLGVEGGEEGAPEVPGPVKAGDFDTKKAAIIKEVTDMFKTTVIPPAIIPAPVDNLTPALVAPTTAITTFITNKNLLTAGVTIPAPIDNFSGGFVAPTTAITSFITQRNLLLAGVTIPAPIDNFSGGFVAALNAITSFVTETAKITTAITIPAPDTSAFTDAFSQMATDVTSSLDEIRAFVADDLSNAFDDFTSSLTDVADEVSNMASDATDSLDEIRAFIADDLTNAWSDWNAAATDAIAGVAKSFDAIDKEAQKAVGEINKITDALNSIPTNITVTITVNATGSGLQFLAGGYHGIVDEPTLFVVGEAGPERVDVEPAAGNINPMFAASRGEPYGIETLEQSRVNTNVPGPYVPPPPMVTQTPQPQPMLANITIPVYLDGKHIDTRQSQRFIRDLGAIIS